MNEVKRMYKVFLSPSAQEFNPYLTGGNEEYYMNLLADEIERILRLNGIQTARNDPSEDFNGAIDRSNEDDYDLHIALHSNASPPNMSGRMQGPVIFFYPDSEKSICISERIGEGFEKIYPDPGKVAVLPSYTLAELRRTKAPAVFAEVAYHDNAQDERWIKQNIPLIASEIAAAIIKYLNSEC